MPGTPEVTEEPGKIIPRRRHARAGLFGIGGGPREQPGGAPSWLWFLIAAAALAIAVVAAIGITSRRPPLVIANATGPQREYADSLVRVLGRDSLDLSANVALGNLLYDTGNFGMAVAYYRRALAVHPDLPDVRVDLAVSLHQSGDSPAAIAELEQVIAAHPGHLIAPINLGIIYESIGRLADAEAVYRGMAGLSLPPELQVALERRLAGLELKKQAVALERKAQAEDARGGSGPPAPPQRPAPGGR